MANKLNEIDWFVWNDKKCTDFGMHVLSQPSVIHPNERMSSINIPGKSGSLTTVEGQDVFNDISLSCVCIIDDQYETDTGDDRIAKICKWLRGSGNLVFASRPGGFYKARIANQITFDKILAGNPHISFSVQFQCSPFFYLDSGTTPINVNGNPVLLTNVGNVSSKPIIKLFGTGEGTLMLGTYTTFISNFDNIKYIILDCDAEIAYTGTPGDPKDPVKLLGTRISGDWPSIPVDDSFVTITGGITNAEIIPRWAYV